MSHAALQLASTESVRRIVRRESESRLVCVQVVAERADRRVPPAANEQPLEEIVVDAVSALEANLLAACFTEAIERFGVRTFRDLVQHFPSVLEDVRASLRVEDPMAIVQSALARASTPPPEPAADDPVGVSVDEMTEVVRVTVAAWPIQEVTALASELGAPQLAHRARVALEGLRAFLLRNDAETKKAVEVAGRAYSRGTLSLEDVAALLRLDPSDAILVLERCGYCRSLDAIRLDEDARSRILELMEQDRRARGGRPAYDRAYVQRDVIASERIEGVDAREWVRGAPT